MQLVYTLSALPAHCFICRCGTRDSYIDTDLSVDVDDPFLANGHVGACYICNECVKEMASKIAWISPDEYEELKKTADWQQTEIYGLTVKIRGLEQALNGLLKAGYKHDSDLGVSRVGGFSPQVDEGSGEESFTEGDSLDSGEGKTAESSDDEGVDELRSDGKQSEPKNNEIDLGF